MNKINRSTQDVHEPGVYEIRIRGHLTGKGDAWFEGLTITLEDNGDSLIRGWVTDQAALHGLLRQVRDLGMPLISVRRIQGGRPAAEGMDSQVG